MLISIGQTTNAITSRMTIWSEGYTVRHIKPLDETVALNNGADFVGESFILLVSCGTVIWEYNRTNEKARLKEEQLRAIAKAERDALQANFVALDARLKALEEVVQYNSQSILNISGKRYKEPTHKVELVPISHDDDTDTKVQQVPSREKKSILRHPITQSHSPIQQPVPNQDTDTTTQDIPTSESRPLWKFW